MVRSPCRFGLDLTRSEDAPVTHGVQDESVGGRIAGLVWRAPGPVVKTRGSSGSRRSSSIQSLRMGRLLWLKDLSHIWGTVETYLEPTDSPERLTGPAASRALSPRRIDARLGGTPVKGQSRACDRGRILSMDVVASGRGNRTVTSDAELSTAASWRAPWRSPSCASRRVKWP